jgi:TonB family protein
MTEATSSVDAYAEFRRQFEAKNYPQAIAPAQAVLALAEKNTAAGSEEVQVALMNLATTQYLAGDYVAAEASYLRVIGLAEASGRPVTQRLARANAGLASTYYAGKRYDLAVVRFDRAAALVRRSEGLLNEHQLPLLDKYADSLTEVGRVDDALKVQRYAYRVATRRYGENDARSAPALEKLGRWYAKVGAYEAAHLILKRAIELVEDAEGPNAPGLIGPLTALAECNRLQLQDPNQFRSASADTDRASMFHDPTAPLPFSPVATASVGQKALERAVAIATRRPDPSRAQVADVQTQLGDWYQTNGQPERALPQYQQAWVAAQPVTFEGKPLADLLFGKPVLLEYSRPDGWNRYAGRPREEIELRTVLLAVTVTAEGGVKDAKVLDDSGDARRAQQALQAAATARYRPRLDNGQPVDTMDVRFMQPWIVLAPKPEPAAATTAPAPGAKP